MTFNLLMVEFNKFIQSVEYKLEAELYFILKIAAWARSIHCTEEGSLDNKFAIKKIYGVLYQICLRCQTTRASHQVFIANELSLAKLSQTTANLKCKTSCINDKTL